MKDESNNDFYEEDWDWKNSEFKLPTQRIHSKKVILKKNNKENNKTPHN
jgi:hypothetical protein